MYPGAVDRASWQTAIPDSHSTVLFDAVTAAHVALLELSGIAYLSQHRDLSESIADAGKAAVEAVSIEVGRIQALPEDEVTTAIVEELRRIAARVQDELDADSDREWYSSAVARGLKDPNDESRTLDGLVLLSTQWDIDPAAAISLLA